MSTTTMKKLAPFPEGERDPIHAVISSSSPIHTVNQFHIKPIQVMMAVTSIAFHLSHLEMSPYILVDNHE
jgi:hypothetical protein